jgi:hypothetical protein
LITLPFTFLSGIVRAMSMPKDIRDSVWRLKNMPMDFDGVFSTLKKMEGKSEFALEREQLLISMRDRKLISAREFEAMTAHGKAEIDHDG